MTRHHFNVADLLLQDDNSEVRTLAAECIGIAFQTGYPVSQEKAEAILWEEATTRFKTSGDFGLQILGMLTRSEDVGRSDRVGLKSVTYPPTLQNNCSTGSIQARAIFLQRNPRISISNRITDASD